MPVPPPLLDRRALQDILAQLRERAAADLPGWTPPPEGDVGTMVQRIFARLIELALQRLNQVPEKNLLAFLDTMGVSLLPPSAAHVPLSFALTLGSPPIFVPKGMQAGTLPSEGPPAVIFETEDDFTIIPAQLATGFTMDPTWDRYADLTSVLNGQSPSGFTPFVGIRRMPHVLYLGDHELLNFARATVDLDFQWEPTRISSADLRTFLAQLTWQCTQNGQLKILTPSIPDTSSPLLRFLGVESIAQSVVQGVSDVPDIRQGKQSRWLQAVLTTPFPDDLVAQALQVMQLKLTVRAGGLLPDLAFSNTAPLDVTKDFLPFGEIPKVGDAFLIGSEEVFSKPDPTVRLSVKALPPTLAWEYASGDDEWKLLPLASINDGTRNFTQSGTISLSVPPNIKRTQVSGESAFWFRVRIAVGPYPGASRVDEFLPRVHITTLEAPVSEGQNRAVLTAPEFVPVGEIVLIGNEFELPSNVTGQNTNVLEVIPPFLTNHDAGTIVRRDWTQVPFAILRQSARIGDREIMVTQQAQEELASGDVLILRGPEQLNSEFVVVSGVQMLPAGGLIIFITRPLRFDHILTTVTTNLSRIRSRNFFGLVEGKRVDFRESFFPFGERPGPGDVFYFSSPRLPPFTLEIDVKLELTPPRVQLTWDFLGANGWQPFPSTSPHGEATPAIIDGTSKFTRDGDIVLQLPPVVAAQVNGRSSYWIRVRLTAGDYGRATEFVPVDPRNPSKGFQARPGTGNLNAPVVTDLKLGYEAERSPTSVLTQDGFLYRDETAANKRPTRFSPFVSVKDLTPELYADPEPAFYLGFDATFPEQPVAIYVAVAPRAFAGRVSKDMRASGTLSSALPALRWEYFNGTIWRELTVFDGTNDLTESGTVEFLSPTNMKPLAKFDLTARYWIRTRSPENDPLDTQRVLGVFLNTVPAIEAVTVQDETLGSGNAQSNQTLRFTRTPVLPGQQVMVREPEPLSDEERLALAAEEGDDAVQERTNSATGETEIWVRWHEVANLIRSDTRSRHYTLDHSTGVLLFGDGTHGLVPPRGTNNIVATYRTGGGTAGNAPKAAIVQVKSPLPGVAAVTNPITADGGAAAETGAMVKERGPQTLKHRDRAVTCADLEWLARQAAGMRVVRTKCLPNVNRDLRFEPGWVTLIIVPQGTASKLSPSVELIRQVEDYLEARAFVGLSQQTPARVNVIGPGYIQVVAVAEVAPEDIDEAQRVKQRALTALDAFFHPLTGGPNGTGWEFGRDVYASEVSQVLEGVAGVSHVKTLQLTANVSQHRLTFSATPSASMALPAGSAVRTADRQKAAWLAEPVPAGSAVKRIVIRGFQEGDRIAKVQDLTVQSVSGTIIIVEPFGSDAAGFPRGSVVMTFDGTRQVRLQRGIPPSRAGETTIEVEEAAFASDLESGDVLTVLYPFPMTVTSVTVDNAAGTQTLGIEPYESEAVFPIPGLLATVDNRTRLPLCTEIPAHETVTSVTLRHFASGDAITLSRRDGAYEIANLEVQGVEPVADIIYLDNNFLVYPGAHRITMVSDARAPSRA